MDVAPAMPIASIYTRLIIVKHAWWAANAFVPNNPAIKTITPKATLSTACVKDMGNDIFLNFFVIGSFMDINCLIHIFNGTIILYLFLFLFDIQIK